MNYFRDHVLSKYVVELYIVIQGCQGTGKTGNLDVHFSRQGKQRICHSNFEVLKIKGYSRIVMGYSYNLLALK